MQAFVRYLALINEDAKMLDCGYLPMLSSSVAVLCSDMVCSLRLQRKKDRLGKDGNSGSVINSVCL
jgi:hypothetical protein